MKLFIELCISFKSKKPIKKSNNLGHSIDEFLLFLPFILHILSEFHTYCTQERLAEKRDEDIERV